MSDHKTLQEAACSAGRPDDDHDVLAQVMDEFAGLREHNDDLRCRVRRLEVRSGRGIMHPSEFSDGMTPRFA